MQYRLVIEYDGTEFHGWQFKPTGERAGARGRVGGLVGEPIQAAPWAMTPACTLAGSGDFHTERDIGLTSCARR
jgi:hypothetical protein